jgi:hypothetical protein
MDEPILFIDRLPLRSKVTREGEKLFDPVIPIVVTHHNIKSLDRKSYKMVHNWAFDTCCEAELITSPEFLGDQYNLAAAPFGSRMETHSNKTNLVPNGFSRIEAQSFGSIEEIPIFRANVWIISNRKELQDRALKLSPGRGITVQPNRQRHLVGRNLLIGKKIKMLIDFDADDPALTVWVPPSLLVINAK